MGETAHKQVIVVGGGIAGLTAAWKLQQSGIDVLILEAEQLVGGRMQSIQLDDALIDTGAQFLSTAYTVIPELIKETGLNDHYVKTSEWVGLIRNENIAIVNMTKPWQLMTKRVVSIVDFIRLGINQTGIFNKSEQLTALNDITAFTAYDDQPADTWVINKFGKSVASELIAPIINGFYFQSLAASSAALPAAVLALSQRKPHTMTLTTGMGSLPLKLAEKLNIKTGIMVTSIEENNTDIRIRANSGEFTAEHVILAVPAPIAMNILPIQDKHASRLLATPYSSTLTIALLTSQSWTPPASYASVYGFVYKPGLNNKLAAVTIETNKCPSRRKAGHLINIMLGDEAAKKLLNSPDEDIYAEIQSDIEKLLPGIFANSIRRKIFRWAYAMPCTHVGHADTVKQYRDSRHTSNRIWLAGDYSGFPWTDSAAQTGVWAANQIRKIILAHIASMP